MWYIQYKNFVIWLGVSVQMSRPRPLAIVPSEVIAVPVHPIKTMQISNQSSMVGIACARKILCPMRSRSTKPETTPNVIDTIL